MTDDTRSQGPGILTGLSIMLAVIAVSLAALELAARVVFDRNGMHYGIEMWKYAKVLKRPSASWDIGHEHVPGGEALLMGVPVEINSLGLREREIEPEKPPGVYRILVLGDSMTFGWGARSEDTYAKRLERALDEASGARRFEVINAGVGNYNTVQEVAYFEQRGLALEPDMVILGFYLNDAEPTPRAKAGFLARHSYLYVLASSFWGAIERSRGEGGAGEYQDYYLDLYADGRPGWQAAQDALVRLIELCRERELALRILLIPELHAPAEGYAFESVHAKLRAIGDANDVPVLEVRQALAGIEPRELWVSPGDAHPNALAHERISQELFRQLGPELLGGDGPGQPRSGVLGARKTQAR